MWFIMGFVSYLFFIIFAIGFVGYVNHKGEWFIMAMAFTALMFGVFIGVIMGLAISDY